ncbi:MAG TPA: CoA-binding protein [Casimicrobiaceae bacterium]|jgi:succinyl-CoA synthetase alpha subunit|nr:CoA-binding protein [Casimicrobiaceae bacterium]
MNKRGVGDFKYYVGISSLAQVATREDRVCVLNILGSESSDVTPIGHTYSGGNVVFGTAPGKRGRVLETKLGPVPVFNNVLEGLAAGHRFNCGVVYLPPSAARDGVAEFIRVNPDLRKIFIVTEKLSVRDSREIRAMAQANGIDIFGGNSLGVADSWNHVRIGGALGGDNPEEALRKGSIAIFSNSGNFTTTIATYLRMAGWGTTTLISSGKDVYIQFAAPEFAFALANDARSKAAVLYVEPGGYYELDADFTKPIVACVVGRWKIKLTRAVGHAGAMSGGGDDALSKERWFMDKLGVDGIFTPDNPVFSARGALVTNIAHIPAAMTAVMRENATRTDFAPEGSLALKPWFASSQGLTLPPALDLVVVEAMPPYNEQIAQLDRQIGSVPPRQNMKDASGASQMDAQTQVTSLYNVAMLEAAQHPIESNIALALLHEMDGVNDQSLINVAIGAGINLHGTPELAAADAARAAGNAPNTVLCAAAAIVGPRRVDGARAVARLLIDRFAAARLTDAADENFDLRKVAADASIRAALVSDQRDAGAEAMLAGVEARQAKSVFVRFVRSLGGYPTADAVLAAITTTLAWGPLMRKRISRVSAENLPWWMRLFATLIGASVDASRHEAKRFCGIANVDIIGRRSLTEVACAALLGQEPTASDLFSFQTLVGLLLTNGPGAISAQGAKGAVSSDGPETPSRIQLNKAMIGFLTHSGYAHGGNGYEGVAFLIERFRGVDLRDPGQKEHNLDLAAMATKFAREYAVQRASSKELGAMQGQAIPCINHPVFKGKPVNIDPREKFVRELFEARGEYNVFHDFYRTLVQALFDAGATRNVFCVNVDALIAALLLKMLWPRYRAGALPEQALETAAFTVFLYGRMIGCAAEIEDHLNRGRNMDTRSPQSICRFVA